jgi:hypothetical protein
VQTIEDAPLQKTQIGRAYVDAISHRNDGKRRRRACNQGEPDRQRDGHRRTQ